MAWSRGWYLLILLAAAAVVVGPAQAEAQTAPAAATGFRVFGVHGAVTAATLSGGGDEASWGPGFFVGIFYTHRPDTFTWQVEGMWHLKGGKFADATVNITQVEFPLMLRINLRADRRTKFHLVAGPSLGMRVTGKIGDVDFTGVLRHFEAGLVLGGGVDVGRAVVGARLMHGLQTTRIQIGGQPTRHRVIAMVLGFKF